MSAIRALGSTSRALARALERLATGKRINRAGDDAAALAIGTGIEGQRRGTLQAVRNMNDAQGFLNTAEGAIAEQTNLLQRMRELALQSANGTLGANDRGYLNTELQKLYQEFQRITAQTHFNGTNLLDGTFATLDLQVGTQKGQTISTNLPGLSASNVFTKTIGSGVFGSVATYSTGSLPYHLRTGDFNGDGYKDIVDAVLGNFQLNVHINSKDGTFKRTTTLATNNGTRDVQVGDVNKDGKDDLVTVDAGSNLSVFIGNGDGTFKARRDFSNVSAGGAYGMAMGDINNDGNLDVLTADSGTGNFHIQMGTGDGGFTASTNLGTYAYQMVDVFLKDLNNDGRLDRVAFNSQLAGKIRIAMGNGDGTFGTDTQLTTGNGTMSESMGRVVDVNGDGKLDLVTSDQNDSTISILLGNGNGTFATRTTISTTSSAGALEVADINDDGNVDFIVSDSTTYNVMIHYGRGGGSFSAGVTSGNIGATVRELTAVDFNNDGAYDLLGRDYTNSQNRILMGGMATTSATNDINIGTPAKASKLLKILDTALSNLNSARANIGAAQSRLEYASNSSAVLMENLSAAQSSIMDADLATETAELTRNQILQQAGVSVLGQANVQMQMVLNLLGSFK